MSDSTNLASEVKPSLLARFYLKLTGHRSRLSMSDFPGGWTDMVYVETFVKFDWKERLKLIFMGRIILKNYVLCEKEPGKTKAITHIYIGHPLDDKNFQLPKPGKSD